MSVVDLFSVARKANSSTEVHQTDVAIFKAAKDESESGNHESNEPQRVLTDSANYIAYTLKSGHVLRFLARTNNRRGALKAHTKPIHAARFVNFRSNVGASASAEEFYVWVVTDDVMDNANNTSSNKTAAVNSSDRLTVNLYFKLKDPVTIVNFTFFINASIGVPDVLILYKNKASILESSKLIRQYEEGHMLTAALNSDARELREMKEDLPLTTLCCNRVGDWFAFTTLPHLLIACTLRNRNTPAWEACQGDAIESLEMLEALTADDPTVLLCGTHQDIFQWILSGESEPVLLRTFHVASHNPATSSLGTQITTMMSSKNAFAVFTEDGNVTVVESKNANPNQFTATTFEMQATVRPPGVRFSRTVDYAFILVAEVKRIRMFQLNLAQPTTTTNTTTTNNAIISSNNNAVTAASSMPTGATETNNTVTTSNVSRNFSPQEKELPRFHSQLSPSAPPFSSATSSPSPPIANMNSNINSSAPLSGIPDPAILSAAARPSKIVTSPSLRLNAGNLNTTATNNTNPASRVEVNQFTSSSSLNNSPVKARITSPTSLMTNADRPNNALTGLIQQLERGNLKPMTISSPTKVGNGATINTNTATSVLNNNNNNSNNETANNINSNNSNNKTTISSVSPSSLTKLMKNVTLPSTSNSINSNVANSNVKSSVLRENNETNMASMQNAETKAQYTEQQNRNDANITTRSPQPATNMPLSSTTTTTTGKKVEDDKHGNTNNTFSSNTNAKNATNVTATSGGGSSSNPNRVSLHNSALLQHTDGVLANATQQSEGIIRDSLEELQTMMKNIVQIAELTPSQITRDHEQLINLALEAQMTELQAALEDEKMKLKERKRKAATAASATNDTKTSSTSSSSVADNKNNGGGSMLNGEESAFNSYAIVQLMHPLSEEIANGVTNGIHDTLRSELDNALHNAFGSSVRESQKAIIKRRLDDALQECTSFFTQELTNRINEFVSRELTQALDVLNNTYQQSIKEYQQLRGVVEQIVDKGNLITEINSLREEVKQLKEQLATDGYVYIGEQSNLPIGANPSTFRLSQQSPETMLSIAKGLIEEGKNNEGLFYITQVQQPKLTLELMRQLSEDNHNALINDPKVNNDMWITVISQLIQTGVVESAKDACMVAELMLDIFAERDTLTNSSTAAIQQLLSNVRHFIAPLQRQMQGNPQVLITLRDLEKCIQEEQLQ